MLNMGLRAITVLATNDPPPTPYLLFILGGFGIGTFGHVIRSKVLIAIGIAVIAITTAVFINATDPQLG